jgi:hypothetical protein
MRPIVLTSLLGIVTSTCLFAGDAIAEQYVTSFRAAVFIGAVKVVDTENPTPDGKHWVMPAKLSDWECGMTNTLFTDDGRYMYRNIRCVNPVTRVVIGASANCSPQKETTSERGFFFRVEDTDVNFYIICSTRKVK